MEAVVAIGARMYAIAHGCNTGVMDRNTSVMDHERAMQCMLMHDAHGMSVRGRGVCTQ